MSIAPPQPRKRQSLAPVESRARPARSERLRARLLASARRTLDLIVAGTVLLLLAVPLMLIAIAIRIDSGGPSLFRQQRVGRDRRTFTMFKFRTMYRDADVSPHREYVRSLIDGGGEGGGDLYKLSVDDRITRVGKVLRAWSLDELPQLINVLFGEMALVGPRPLPLYHLEQLPLPVRDQRARMRPGMTGLWQVSGRSDAGTDGMARWDPYYVRNWSIWLDIVILVRTVRVVLTGSGAR